MKLPCELVVWYVLPSIRSELTKELVKLGLSQKEVSERLEITQAAVSQLKQPPVLLCMDGSEKEVSTPLTWGKIWLNG